MTVATNTAPLPPIGVRRPPPWRDIRVVRAVLQFIFVGAVVLVVWWLYDNLLTNMRRQGIPTDFDYLDQPAGFEIRGSDFRASQTVREALYVGVRNTAVLAAIGVVLTTVLGLVVGVARLSSNWLVSKAAAVYVETLRNVPPLLVILFVNSAMILQLPRIQEASTPGGLFVLSNRELAVPSLRSENGATAYAVLLVSATLAAIALGAWRTRRRDRTGEPHHRVLLGFVLIGTVAVAGYLALGGPFTVSRPSAQGFRIEGGAKMTAPYASMLIALVIYTASHVAEIVRGSIQAVPKGQTEAASALALNDLQRLRFVILPQALRVAIPPTINQYLNFTKNTSLGIAIAYPEVMAITFVVIGNGNPAPQSFLVAMGIYLTFSLVISVLLNAVNRRLRLVER